jgi:hypothetical protein
VRQSVPATIATRDGRNNALVTAAGRAIYLNIANKLNLFGDIRLFVLD